MAKTIHRLLEKNVETMTGICSHCGSVDLRKNKSGVICAISKWESNRRNKMKTKYGHMTGVTEKPVQCQICGKTKRLCLDHDHATGLFRGWLCHSCNLVLGNAYDDPMILEKAKEYLYGTHARTIERSNGDT